MGNRLAIAASCAETMGKTRIVFTNYAHGICSGYLLTDHLLDRAEHVLKVVHDLPRWIGYSRAHGHLHGLKSQDPLLAYGERRVGDGL
jgi:hypothetical protein